MMVSWVMCFDLGDGCQAQLFVRTSLALLFCCVFSGCGATE